MASEERILIGARYCGGCNPTYDRKEAVEALAREIGFEVVGYDHKEVKGLLLLCGCPSSCPLEKDFAEPSCPWFAVRNEEDLEEAKKWLLQLLGQHR